MHYVNNEFLKNRNLQNHPLFPAAVTATLLTVLKQLTGCLTQKAVREKNKQKRNS